MEKVLKAKVVSVEKLKDSMMSPIIGKEMMKFWPKCVVKLKSFEIKIILPKTNKYSSIVSMRWWPDGR